MTKLEKAEQLIDESQQITLTRLIDKINAITLSGFNPDLVEVFNLEMRTLLAVDARRIRKIMQQHGMPERKDDDGDKIQS